MFIAGEIFLLSFFFFSGGTSAFVWLPSDRKGFLDWMSVNIVDFNNRDILFCFPKRFLNSFFFSTYLEVWLLYCQAPRLVVCVFSTE